MRIAILIVAIIGLILAGCGIGDVNSDTSNSSARDDHSINNGIANCEITCEPTEDGWIVSEICSGLIQDGPEFASQEPPSCKGESDESTSSSDEPASNISNSSSFTFGGQT